MPDPRDFSDDRQALLEWYEDRWKELKDILSVSRAEKVTGRVRELQLDALQERAEALARRDWNGAEEARRELTRIETERERIRSEQRLLESIRQKLNVSDSGSLLERIDGLLQERESLRSAQQAFRDAGFESADQAVEIIRSMEEQLDQLYDEKEATLQTEERADEIARRGDTFEQLEALLAREERLQRELGVSSSEEIISMVNGLVDQLEELYARQDASGIDSSNGTAPSEDPFARLERLLDREQTLQEELGVSNPDEVVAMVQGLTQQLDDLYSARERLARINLDDADSVVDMVGNMQAQLEVLYEDQERLSKQGIDGVDHALSMIHSMEEQLSQLYEERQKKNDGAPDESLDRLRDRLASLREEKEALLERREKLESKTSSYEQTLTALENNLGTSDPDTISQMVDSMEEQLEDIYQNREAPPIPESDSEPSETGPLLDRADLERLDTFSGEQLNALSVGAFCLDDDGTVRRANRAALHWPGLRFETPSALEGRNFFFDLAPATNNPPFRGRFLRGVREGELDTRFPYTYVTRDVPLTGLVVHLYRSGASSTWVLFDNLETESP
jgi:photoactive yellow protein